MAKYKFNCVDLFAGAGGFSLAASNAGINVVAAVEWNPKACETYRHNLINNKKHVLYEEDILQFKPQSLYRNHFSNGVGCDILLGGPPCQGFSVHRLNDAGVDDPRNELLLRYFAFVKKLKPKVFLMENVPGLLWKRHEDFLNEFYKQGRKAKYKVYAPEVIDAQCYGVPQRRKRVFILGVRNDIELDIVWPPKPTHGDEKAREVDPNLKPLVTASPIFRKRVLKSDNNNIHMKHGPELIVVFKKTPINGGSRKDSGRVLPCHKNHNGHKDVYGRIDPNKPGPTMTTACINPSKGRFVHPTEHHGITLRHAARFQTFPDDFVFKGGLIAAGEQIGNAVPVKLGEVLLTTIAAGLRKWSRKDA
ncbi:DNA cytosine methyltransferase [Sulfuriflexus mobilis]|uniref:DNA cytosine methyltransferase n=1 Tax=Sulfuriflexus mobilis TaxID=1811807 RepID=UPI000F8339F6|nr:DNA cytosine methyltransferase [Sulfuriflexus mobilis]